MDGYLVALALAVMPALGNLAGGLLAEGFRISERSLSLALHAAEGIVIAVVAVELMPQVLRADPPWVVVLAFVAGGGVFILLDWLTDMVQSRRGGGEGAAPWMIYFGVCIDLFSDGLMIGTGSTVALSLGLLLALGQIPADLPEGFSVGAMFRRAGFPRTRRLLLAASFAGPVLLGTTVGYWAVRGQQEVIKLVLLAFTGGMMTTLAVEEVMVEAHRGGDTRLGTGVFVAGFGLFALLAVLLG